MIDRQWAEGARPSFSERVDSTSQVVAAIQRKQEEMFTVWLEENGLQDFRTMVPGSAQRERMKSRTFVLLWSEGGHA